MLASNDHVTMIAELLERKSHGKLFFVASFAFHSVRMRGFSVTFKDKSLTLVFGHLKSGVREVTDHLGFGISFLVLLGLHTLSMLQNLSCSLVCSRLSKCLLVLSIDDFGALILQCSDFFHNLVGFLFYLGV